MGGERHHLIGEMLVQLGFVNLSQVNEARRRQMAQPQVPLGEHLVRLGYVTPTQLQEALSMQVGDLPSTSKNRSSSPPIIPS